MKTILFAPVLKSEHWTSIDLQQLNILEALEKHHPELIVSILDLPEQWANIPMGRRLLRDFYYPALIRSECAQRSHLLHIGDHSYGHLCRSHQPCVINCNDLHHLVSPDLRGITLWRWRQRVQQLHHASRVLTISEHLAVEVKEHLKLSDEQVTALPSGIDTDVFQTHSNSLDQALALLPELAGVRQNHYLVTNIGTNIPRKNIPTLLRALHHLINHYRVPVKLLKAGPALASSHHAALIDELNLVDHVIDLGALPAPKVAALCHLSHALSFPSLYEGFGRPTIEAQACSLPCVLSDSSCMKEVGGDAALYHAPLDFECLASHLHSCLTNDDQRRVLIRRGLENAKRFSWEKYAQKLVQVYSELW